MIDPFLGLRPKDRLAGASECLEDLNAGNPKLCQEISAGAGVGINEAASGTCPGPALIERLRMHLAGGVVAPEDLIDSANFSAASICQVELALPGLAGEPMKVIVEPTLA